MVSVYIHLGSYGKCPDCGQDTFVQSASILGDDLPETWTAHRHLLFSISKSISQNYKFPRTSKDKLERLSRSDKGESKKIKVSRRVVCSKCSKTPSRVFWMEPVEGAFIGPLCKVCVTNEAGELDGGVNPRLYSSRGNKQVVSMARASLILGKAVHEVIDLPNDEEVFLF